MNLYRSLNFYLLLIALLFAVPVICTADDAVQQPDQSLIDALNAICTPTESSLTKELAEKPNDISVRLKYADFLLDNKKVNEALAEYTKISQMDKRSVDALIGSACCYDRQGNKSMALAACKSACQIDPANTDGLIVYLTLAQKYGKIKEAMPALISLTQADRSKAALCCWSIAEWIVERDHWGAQPFAQEAHKLDAKAYPKSEISAKPIKFTPGDGTAVVLSAGSSWKQRFSFNAAPLQGMSPMGLGSPSSGGAGRAGVAGVPSGGGRGAGGAGGIGGVGGTRGGGVPACPPPRPVGGGSG